MLGCAGMADLAADLSARHALPVVDGVAAAVVLIEALARLGLRTSKLAGYATPLPKLIRGFSGLFHSLPRPASSAGLEGEDTAFERRLPPAQRSWGEVSESGRSPPPSVIPRPA